MYTSPSVIPRKTSVNSEDLASAHAERGRQIQFARVLQDLTQADLARRSGVTVTTIYRAEKGLPVREKSLDKIAHGLDMRLDRLLVKKPVMSSETSAFLRHRASENVWYAPIDHRRNIPEDNKTLLRSPSERRRLGRLGLTPIFVCYPRLIMAEGPGATLIEVYGRYPHPFNVEIYRDCIIHCLRGRIRVAILDDIVDLGEGDFVGLASRNLSWIEPAAPIDIDDPTPLALWMGAVRLGRLVQAEGRRSIVRKPRKVD